MSDLVRYEEQLPDPSELRDPLLIAGFGGAWGTSAAEALRELVERWEAQPLASVDPQPFFDFTVRRPRVRVVDGEGAEAGVRAIDWPANELYLARPEGAERDLVLLVGSEPQLRWREFIEALMEPLERFGVSESLMLGAYRAATPHSRPLPVQLYSRDAQLAARFGLVPEAWSYEGPAGITTPLAVACEERGWSSSSLLAAAPFYVSVEPHPFAARALIEGARPGAQRRGRQRRLRRTDRGAVRGGRGRPGTLRRVRPLRRDPRAELRRHAPRARLDRHERGARRAGARRGRRVVPAPAARLRGQRTPAERDGLRLTVAGPQARPDGVRWCWNWLAPGVGSPATSSMISWHIGRPG